mgnify:FL=1
MTGLPILKGDRYFIGAWSDNGDFCSIKALACIQGTVDWALQNDEYDNEGWDPWMADEYLFAWLKHHLGRDSEEALVCRDAAVEFWRSNR